MTDLQAIVCGCAALVLGSAAIRKGVDARGFQKVLARHPHLRAASPVLVRSVPVVEATLAVLLLALPSVGIVSGAASVLFLAFVVVTLTSPPGDCGCGPFVPERRSRRHVTNIAFAAVLAATAVGVDPSPRGDRVLVAASVLTAFLIVKVVRSALDTRARLRRPPVVGGSTAPVESPVRLVPHP